jgi:uncharacterized damage-inducible protein DinB
MLEGWLEFHRATLLHKCAGLSDEQLKEASCPPSNLTLLGLVRHMADVERSWFRSRFAGQQVGPLYFSEANPDGEFADVAAADAAADLDVFAGELEQARRAAAGRSLDDTFLHTYPAPDTRVSLRWIYLHMIEEYARHNGHADLIRERIDGTTGV